MTETSPETENNPPQTDDLAFGAEIDVEGAGFSFRPIKGFELEIDGTVYMYSEDGNIEISLVGSELREGVSIAELNDDLASEFMANFDESDLIEAGTDTIQRITGFLNEIEFVNAEEEGKGVALICSPHLNQYFFMLIIADADDWDERGPAIFEALKGHIRFYPQFRPQEAQVKSDPNPDLTVETFQDIDLDDDFVLHIERGDVSILLAARTPDPHSEVTLTDVTAPNGQSLYHFDPSTGQLESSFCSRPVSGDHGELCFFLPRDNQQGLHPGDYQFGFTTSSGSRLEEIQVIIRAGRALEAQAFDLNFWISAEDPAFANPEIVEATFADLRRRLGQRLTPLNLAPGKIAVYQAAPDELELFSNLDVEKDLADCSYMIAETATNERALNVGLVQTLTEDVNGEPVEREAASAGLPGMILSRISPHACVLLSWSALGSDPDRFVQVLIEQMIAFSGIDNPLEKGQPLQLNREIAWRLRRHPLFYDAS
ncbi:hypothetical protein KQH62_00785 [bacterium]|nr:hypothetical protein [bacterium]